MEAAYKLYRSSDLLRAFQDFKEADRQKVAELVAQFDYISVIENDGILEHNGSLPHFVLLNALRAVVHYKPHCLKSFLRGVGAVVSRDTKKELKLIEECEFQKASKFIRKTGEKAAEEAINATKKSNYVSSLKQFVRKS